MSRRFVKLTRPAIRALQHGSITEHGIDTISAPGEGREAGQALAINN